jgi:hypothetical protein
MLKACTNVTMLVDGEKSDFKLEEKIITLREYFNFQSWW